MVGFLRSDGAAIRKRPLTAGEGDGIVVMPPIMKSTTADATAIVAAVVRRRVRRRAGANRCYMCVCEVCEGR